VRAFGSRAASRRFSVPRAPALGRILGGGVSPPTRYPLYSHLRVLPEPWAAPAGKNSGLKGKNVNTLR
ncbi:MAG: hypothetical protein ACPLPR_10155, partial [Bacillota bacterium]